MRTSPVVIVGAGIAGLICAIDLHRAGRAVLVLEREAEVGGRVRTDHVDGMLLDRGFQVLFTAYPTLTSYLDLDALALRRFTPAARVVRNGHVSLMGDALRAPSLLLDTIFADAAPLGDKLRLLALRRLATGLSIEECFAARYDALSTRTFLEQRGFAAETIDGFFAPFYGGILLDRTLSTSASVLLFTFKMLSEGDTAVPARGMSAIPRQLAALLPPGTVRTAAPVEALTLAQQSDAGTMRIGGVTLAGDEHIAADHVVLATDAPHAAQLARTVGVTLTVPPGARGCTTLYYAVTESPLPGKALWLNADDGATVSHAITITDVAPEYASPLSSPASSPAAPVRRALIAATALGDAAYLPDDVLDTRARRDIGAMAHAAHADVDVRLSGRHALTRLAICRVPYAQFAQPPGERERRATISGGMPGLWRASEVLHSSSLEGAARGGRDAALAILGTRTPLAP